MVAHALAEDRSVFLRGRTVSDKRYGITHGLRVPAPLWAWSHPGPTPTCPTQFASLNVKRDCAVYSRPAHGGRNEPREIYRPPAGGVVVTRLGGTAAEGVNVIVAKGDVDQGLRVSCPELVEERVDQAEGRLPVKGGSLVGEGDPARH